jgi:transcriptional regulator
MKEKKNDLLQGTLDLLVLKSLALGPLHGLGVSDRIKQITQGAFQVKPGSLFPALHRLEEAGWLKSSWGESENNRRAKYYRLTKAKLTTGNAFRWQSAAPSKQYRKEAHATLASPQ